MSLASIRDVLMRWLFTPLVGVRLGDWWPVLRRHWRGIPGAYWPRTAFTTSMAALNSALSWREERRYGPALADIAVQAPVFILGHYRSGTTHLWNLLACDPRFAYPTVPQALFPHTFLTFEHVVRRFGPHLTPERRSQDNVEFSLDAALEEERALCAATFLSIDMARHFPSARADFERYLTLREVDAAERDAWAAALDRFARKLLFRYGSDRTLLFKESAHTGRIALLRTLYPEARFVHIHRDPYTVFVSTRHWERTTRPLYGYQPTAPEELDAFILWRYQAMYEAFFEDVDGIPPGHFSEVSFTELDRDPVDTVARVYTELGLDGFAEVRPRLEAYVGTLSDYRRNSYPPLSESLRSRVAAAWGRSFKQWDYAT